MPWKLNTVISKIPFTGKSRREETDVDNTSETSSSKKPKGPSAPQKQLKQGNLSKFFSSGASMLRLSELNIHDTGETNASAVPHQDVNIDDTRETNASGVPHPEVNIHDTGETNASVVPHRDVNIDDTGETNASRVPYPDENTPTLNENTKSIESIDIIRELQNIELNANSTASVENIELNQSNIAAEETFCITERIESLHLRDTFPPTISEEQNTAAQGRSDAPGSEECEYEFEIEDTGGDSSFDINRVFTDLEELMQSGFQITPGQKKCERVWIGGKLVTIYFWQDKFKTQGFIKFTQPDSLDRPECFLCGEVLFNSALKTSKLERHQRSRHPESFGFSSEKWKQELDEYLASKKKYRRLQTFFPITKSTLLQAQTEIIYMMGKCKVAHVLGEKIIKPVIVRVVYLLCGLQMARHANSIHLGRTKVKETIVEMANNIEGKVLAEIKSLGVCLSLQVDISTDINSRNQLIGYARYPVKSAQGNYVKEEYLFMLAFSSTTTSPDIFGLVFGYLNARGISLKQVSSICTDGAKSMTGVRAGFVKLVENVNPSVVGYNCALHRFVLAVKPLPDDLFAVLDLSMQVINFIRRSPVRYNSFRELCEEMEAEYSSLKYISDSRWLSRGHALTRLYELYDKVVAFLRLQNFSLTDKFVEPLFQMRLAYLSDAFKKINKVNTSLQGKYVNIEQLGEMLDPFVKELNYWGPCVDAENFHPFAQLEKLIMAGKIVTPENKKKLVDDIKDHCKNLQAGLKKHDLDNGFEIKDWIQRPLSAPLDDIPDSFRFKTDLLHMRANNQVISLFASTKRLSDFWAQTYSFFPGIAEEALNFLTAYVTTWRSESGFSFMNHIVSKERNRSDGIAEMRVGCSDTEPDCILAIRKSEIPI